jgi:hypothetical protein
MIDQAVAIALAKEFLRTIEDTDLPLIHVSHASKQTYFSETGYMPSNGNYFISFGIQCDKRIDNLYNIKVNDETGEATEFVQLL